jgi:hypothetical protein
MVNFDNAPLLKRLAGPIYRVSAAGILLCDELTYEQEATRLRVDYKGKQHD